MGTLTQSATTSENKDLELLMLSWTKPANQKSFNSPTGFTQSGNKESRLLVSAKLA
jgi:hypothetical protein